MRSHPLSFCLAAVLLLGLPVLAAEDAPAGRVRGAVQQWTAQRAGKVPPRVAEALPRFYAARAYQPAWFLEGVALAQAQAYLLALDDVEREGLRPERYQRDGLTQALGGLAQEGGSGDAWLALEVRLTESFLTYASHLSYGQVAAESLRWRTKKPAVDLEAVLAEALGSGEPRAVLGRLAPRHEGYGHLKDALARYRAIAADGGWPRLPPGTRLQLGARDARVAVLRQRLRVTGELLEAPPSVVQQLVASVLASSVQPPPEGEAARASFTDEPTAAGSDEEFFDEALEESVKAFQRRHGLEPDGQVGGRTLAALRVPVEERIEQLRVNLERWRWLPPELGERHLLVNLPAFELVAVQAGEPALRMRVIVGKEDWSTPVFSSRVEHLVLNPSWFVPRRIAQEELLPQLQEDPGAASKLGVTVSRRDSGQVVDSQEVDWTQEAAAYRLFQPPGPSNPLGRVKFVLPNRYAIFLHGTPHGRLFSQAQRALSHGCVRLEQPLALAAFLLEGLEGWDTAALEAAVARGKTKQVELAEPVPVYLLYWTAFVDARGEVNFRPDIYRHDGRLGRALGLERTPRS